MDKVKIFSSIRDLLGRYSPPMVVKSETEIQYELWSVKDVVIAGKKKNELFFASAIIQKSYVGFYFMPIYTDPELSEVISPMLLKTLKGKSCFHIKEISEQVMKDIDLALKVGFDKYREKGWV